MENSKLLKNSLDSFQSALNKAKSKYQFHMRLLTKKTPPKVHVEVIKKGPLVDPLSSLLFGTTDGVTKDKDKAMSCTAFGLVVV